MRKGFNQTEGGWNGELIRTMEKANHSQERGGFSDWCISEPYSPPAPYCHLDQCGLLPEKLLAHFQIDSYVAGAYSKKRDQMLPSLKKTSSNQNCQWDTGNFTVLVSLHCHVVI